MSIDASMDAHFSSIQDTFVPAEVQQLIDRLQGKLSEVRFQRARANVCVCVLCVSAMPRFMIRDKRLAH